MNELDVPHMPKLRILGVSTSYPVRCGSSAGIFVHRLYREMSSSCDVSVVCPGDSSADYARVNQGVSVLPVDYAPRSLRVLGGAGGIIPSIRSAPVKLLLLPGLLLGMFASVLKRGRSVDIIHANWAICGMLAGLAGRLLGKPVVTTLRGDDITRASHSAIDRLFLVCAVRWSRKIICVSEPMAERLKVKFPSRKADIHACLNGVDDSFFAVRHQECDSLLLRVVSVGSLIQRKAYDILVRAIAQCHERQNIRLRIIGDGPCQQELDLLRHSLGLSGQIEFEGELSQDGIIRAFAESDVFVLPSRSEGRPNAVIEAIAAGLPVISTDLDGVRGLVVPESNGWLFAVDDMDGLAECLDLAFREKSGLQAMGEAGRAMLSAGAGWTRTARCYEHVFHEVLSPGGSW